MSDYGFSVLDVFAETYAVAPQLTARLRIEEHTGAVVHAVVLRCQVRIEPQRRRYESSEADGLRGLFGDRSRWVDTLKPFLWMQCNTTVQGFTGATDVDLVLPCTYDFDVIGSKYLHALQADTTVPINFLFSGTVFTKGTSGSAAEARGFSVQQIPWDCEAAYDLPVAVWQQMIASYFPNSGWIRLDQEVLAQFADYRARHELMTWDETVRALLASAGEAVS